MNLIPYSDEMCQVIIHTAEMLIGQSSIRVDDRPRVNGNRTCHPMMKANLLYGYWCQWYFSTVSPFERFGAGVLNEPPYFCLTHLHKMTRGTCLYSSSHRKCPRISQWSWVGSSTKPNPACCKCLSRLRVVSRHPF